MPPTGGLPAMTGLCGIFRSLAVLGPCLICVASIGAEPGMQDGELTRAQAPAQPGSPALPLLPIDRPAVGPAPAFRPGTTPPVGPNPLSLARQTFGVPTLGGARPPGPSLTSLERFPLVGIPQMLGDQSPIFGPAQTAPAPSGGNTVRLPWVRGYKMADNQSPWPIDRVFVASYYYDDLNFGT